MSANVLVIGGAGYIGSHACKQLHSSGYTPVTFDNLEGGHEWAVKWGPLVRGDIRDFQAVDAAIREFKPSAVMHFAAHLDVGESVRDPGKYYHNNVAGTLNVLRSMVDNGVERFILSSTCATYGEPNAIPITEDHPQNPINPYGTSKLMVEMMLRDFDHAYGLKSVALRYFNAAGADPDGQIGEAHRREFHLIPLIIFAAQGKRDAISIFGNDYPTPDGTCVRDYIHVTDLADAHVLAMKYLADGHPSAAFNLGNNQGYSVAEVIDMVRRVSGRAFTVKQAERRPGDPARLVGDHAKAKAVLGWAPKFDSLEAIVETAWKWHETYDDTQA